MNLLWAVAVLAFQTALPPGHPKLEPQSEDGGSPVSSEKLLQQLDSMKDLASKEKTFDIAVAIGRLYYSSGRYTDAAQYLEQAVAKGEPARRLFLQKNNRSAKQGGDKCPAPDDTALDTLVQKVQTMVKAGEGGAAACAKVAVDRVLDVQRLLANAYFLTGRSAKALVELDQILKISDSNSEAIFARAAILYDSQGDNPAALADAKKGFERFVVLAPESPHAENARQLVARIQQVIAAGGVTAYGKKRPSPRDASSRSTGMSPETALPSAPALSRDVLDAIQNTEQTPELEKNLLQMVDEGEEHLARGRFDEALIAYRNVMPYRPQNPRVQAGMAWALNGLKKPMAPRVWSVAVKTDPSAVEKLGDTLNSKGNAKDARALWNKLAETDPEYADKSGLRSKLK